MKRFMRGNTAWNSVNSDTDTQDFRIAILYVSKKKQQNNIILKCLVLLFASLEWTLRGKKYFILFFPFVSCLKSSVKYELIDLNGSL